MTWSCPPARSIAWRRRGRPSKRSRTRFRRADCCWPSSLHPRSSATSSAVSTPRGSTSGAGNFPIGPLQDAEGWKRLLKSAGLIGGFAEEIAVSGGKSMLVFGEKSPKIATGAAEPRSLLLVRGKSERARAITASLSKLLLAQGHGVAITDESEIERYASDAKRDHVIYVAPAQGDGDPADALAKRCLNAKRVVERLQGSQADLWIVTSGAWAQGRDRFGAIDTGLWTFLRTFANELNSTQIHVADIAAELDAEAASVQLADAVLTRTAETELSIRPDEVRAVRVIRAADVPRQRHERRGGAREALARRLWRPRPHELDAARARHAQGERSRDRDRGDRPQFPRPDVGDVAAAGRHAGRRVRRPDARLGIRRPRRACR